MPGSRAEVWLVTDDEELRAQVMRHKPPGARLKCLAAQEATGRSGKLTGQAWLDLECAPGCMAPRAARRVYFYRRLPPDAGNLAAGLFIRKPCSPAVFEVLWAGVVGGMASEARPRAVDENQALPGWILSYLDLNLKSLCRKCVTDLPARLGYRDASLYLHDVDAGQLTLAECRRARRLPPAVPLHGDPSSLMATVARRGATLLTGNVADHRQRLGLAQPADRSYADAACLIVPLVSDGRLWGVLNLAGRQRDAQAITEAALDGVVAFLGRALHHARLYDAARTEARVDSLTGLYNQRWIMEAMEREIRRAQRFSATLSALMIDVDALKAVNDRAGHAAGDCLLRHVAARISAVLRQFDAAARVGGDEFVVVLPGTALAGAQQVARRLVDSIRQDAAHFQDSPLPTTVSVGVAQWQTGWTARQLVDAADRAMYRAKQQGRDNVVCHVAAAEDAAPPAAPDPQSRVTRAGPARAL